MTKKTSEQIRYPYWRPIGYHEAKRALAKIEEYSDLVKLIMPTLSPEEKEKIQVKYPDYESLDRDSLVKIRQRLTQMSMPMIIVFNRINLSPLYEHGWNEREYDPDKGRTNIIKKKIIKNLFLDLFGNPPITNYRQFEFLMEHLEIAKGGYVHIMTMSKKRCLKPTWWIAQIIRIPISIIEYAGVDTQNEETNKMVYWVINVLMGMLLALLIVRLGLPLKTLLKL